MPVTVLFAVATFASVYVPPVATTFSLASTPLSASTMPVTFVLSLDHVIAPSGTAVVPS